MTLSESDFRFLFAALLDREPSENELQLYMVNTGSSSMEAVALICGTPEFTMKHPSFTPKPMAEAMVPAVVNGIDMLVPSNDWVHWGTAQGWGWEAWVAGAMRSILAPGKVFMDVGANVGALTMLGSSLVGPEGRVYAVEASIENAAMILANARHVAASNMVVVPVAASDKVGTEFISVDYGGSNKFVRTEPIPSANFKFEAVLTCTLDSLFPFVDRLDLIKIDVEGREGSVLRGAKDLLARTRPQIIAEYHSGSPEPWYVKEVVDQNYTVSVLARDGSQQDLGENVDALTSVAAKTLQTAGTCLEILLSPRS